VGRGGEAGQQGVTAAQTLVYLETRRLLDRAVRLAGQQPPLADRRGRRDRPAARGVDDLLPQLASVVVGAERRSMVAHAAKLGEEGIPTDLAKATTRVVYGFGLLDILETAKATGRRQPRSRRSISSCRNASRSTSCCHTSPGCPRRPLADAGPHGRALSTCTRRCGIDGEVLQSTPADATPEDRISEWNRSRGIDHQGGQRNGQLGRFSGRPGRVVGSPPADPHPGQDVGRRLTAALGRAAGSRTTVSPAAESPAAGVSGRSSSSICLAMAWANAAGRGVISRCDLAVP